MTTESIESDVVVCYIRYIKTVTNDTSDALRMGHRGYNAMRVGLRTDSD